MGFGVGLFYVYCYYVLFALDFVVKDYYESFFVHDCLDFADNENWVNLVVVDDRYYGDDDVDVDVVVEPVFVVVTVDEIEQQHFDVYLLVMVYVPDDD